ncbi:neprilysin-1-like [Dermacentor variabilis]|uniref:neprilysin-1-like n=1 Tax=Dermacentor variabilis TaxID=34621 RepID=UPI003F5B10DC
MPDRRRRSSLRRHDDRRRSRSEERHSPRSASVSFDDTPSDRPRRPSRESTHDDSSSSGEYEIVEVYNEDSVGDDDRWDDSDKDKTMSGSDAYNHSQAYMIIAAVMVASAFLGVLMKFAFTPSHSGHSHGLRRIPGRVLVEETDTTTLFEVTPPVGKINVSAIRDLATVVKSSTTAEAAQPAPRKSAFTYECRTDACLWQSRLIYDKINQSIGPCEDFYAYVCSNRWYNGELEVQSRPYVISGPGLLILDIAKFLLQQKMREQPSTSFITQSSMLLKTCIQVRNSSSSNNDWEDIKKVLESYSLTNWPFTTDPPTVKFQDVLRLVDKRLNLLAVVHVTLRKRFENEGYMLHLDSPKLTMVRHQLTFLDEGFQEYKNCIKRAFTLLGSKVETDHIADDVLEFERKLDEASLPPKRFVSILNSTVSIVNLKRAGKLEWDAYLTYLQPGSDKVIVLNSAFINKLSGILTSTALSTLLNYIGFRIVVLLSPLLPKQAEFLVPLSYDDHIHKYNARLQACIHLVERLFPYGIRKIARSAMGKTTMEQIAYDHNLDRLVSSVKGVVSQTVARAPWLTQAEADVATQKIESLEVDFIGAKEHMDVLIGYYQSKVHASFAAPLRDYTALLNETMSRYWLSKDNADYDARYHVSSLRPGYEYNAGKNVLHVPFGVVALQQRVAQSAIPAILLPFIVPYLVEGMYEAIDVRGSTINVRGMPETWWSSETLVRYRQQQKCFTQNYLDSIQRFGTFQESPMAPFLRSFMAEIAAILPSYEAYVRALVAPHSMQRNFRIPGLPDLTPEMLFFVDYAAVHCDPVSSQGLTALDKRRLRYRVALPSALRVNIALRHFDTFAETFSCNRGTNMNPGAKCRLW